MGGFSFGSLLPANAPQFVTGIVDLKIAQIGGQQQLFAASGADGGIAVYQLSDGSGAVPIGHLLYGGANATAPNRIEVFDRDGAAVIMPLDLAAGPAARGAAPLDQPAAIATVDIGGQTLVFTSYNGSGLVHGHWLAPDGSLIPAGAPVELAAPYQGIAIPHLAVAEVDGAPILLALSAVENRVISLRIAPDGGLVPVTSLGAQEGLGMTAPTALAVAQVAGESFAIIGASQSSSLSVARIRADGGLQPVDHIIDDLNTRFQAVQTIDVAMINERAFVVAGGGDDGLTLFELLPGGRLLARDTIADSAEMALANVSALAMADVGGTLQIFAASQSEPGITQLLVNTADYTAPVFAPDVASHLVGDAGHNLLIGGAGNDLIEGGPGNDILIDGPGSDRLRGGPGADIFVLIADNEVDYIEDFEPGIDRLDLSDFPMFYGLDQLEITPTATGATLRYRDELIIVTSAALTPLYAHHFAISGVSGVTRPPMLAQEAGRVFEGTSGPDILTGGSGDDHFFASPGADMINGMSGFDTVDYSRSDAAIRVSLAGGAGIGGFAEGDILQSIEALIGSDFNDILFGNDGDNLLRGGDGDDHIYGLPGDDIIHGGSGNDYLTGGLGDDVIYGGPGDDHLIGHAGDDILYGGEGDDILSGGLGNDRVYGGPGDDKLYGHDGDDWLDGGPGNDVLFGGAGQDTFVFGVGYGRDRVQDFDLATDTLRLEQALWGGGLSVAQMLDRYAHERYGNVTLSFGDEVITLANIAYADSLIDSIILF